MTGRPHASEPRTILDSWPFIVFGLVVGFGILLLRAWGWL